MSHLDTHPGPISQMLCLAIAEVKSDGFIDPRQPVPTLPPALSRTGALRPVRARVVQCKLQYLSQALSGCLGVHLPSPPPRPVRRAQE